MSSPPADSGDGSVVEASVTIHRPVHEVFAFYRDFRNLPRFLGDVLAVEPIDGERAQWTVQGPLGVRVRWTTRTVEVRPNALIRYQVDRAGAAWEVHFRRGALEDTTEVRERMYLPLGTLGRAALTLLGKPPAAEVAANLRRLRQLLETGRVTDLSHSVPGKFDGG